MTFAEMTPEKWRMLAWIVTFLGFLWCGYALLRKARKVKNEAGDGHTSRDYD